MLRFCINHFWFLESFRRKQLISCMNHKAKKLSRNRCRKKDHCRSGTANGEWRTANGERRTISVFSKASCEKPEATVVHLLLRANIQIL
jgi:hypothetical protein